MGAVDIQIAMTVFHVGVALASIFPRLPNDVPFPRSMGGDLSRPFRKILMMLTLLNVIRLFVFDDLRFGDSRTGALSKKEHFMYWLYLISSATEAFFRSFLCLLTPYLLQCQLQNRINIGRPGRDLMMWVYAVLFFNIMGCLIVQMTEDPRYWALKKLGDAISFLPVYKTLKLYNTIMTQGGRYPGRGNMTSQSLMIVEYLTVIATLLSALAYFFISSDEMDFASTLGAFRIIGAFANMTRVLCHAMLLNSLDEANYLHSFARQGTENNDTENEETNNHQHAQHPTSQSEPLSIALLK
mmetsp:Transcript_28822/g.47674  ORF Transcript_28822/g.47674 Transcript_28822/m.47674 type:complete len:298 (+) Transcript_28822:97-990(+)